MRLTRRRWMVAAGAATAAAALPRPLEAARAESPDLPPALAPEVFRERQARLRAAARARGIDVLFVTPSTNLSYAANISMGRSERLTALLLFVDGPASLLTPASQRTEDRGVDRLRA